MAVGRKTANNPLEPQASDRLSAVRRSQELDQPDVRKMHDAGMASEKESGMNVPNVGTASPIRSTSVNLANPGRSTFRTRNITRFAQASIVIVTASLLFSAYFTYVCCPTSARVMAYLDRAERKERDVWFADDYRIAWQCVRLAAEGHPDPWGYAFWLSIGIHFEKFLAAQDAYRRAQLGSEYGAWYGVGGAAPSSTGAASSPKKPVQSERRTKARAA